MAEKPRLTALLATIALVAMVVGACAPMATPSPAPSPEPTPAPGGPISSEEAAEIVIKTVIEPSEAPRGLRAHIFPELLSGGARIVPFKMWVEQEGEPFVCRQECWFFWLDDDPLAQFAHETRYVLVDALTKEVRIEKAEWWPVVNDKVMWGTTDERASDKLLVFEKTTEFKVPVGWEHKFNIPQASPGCEVWAVLVCGSYDPGNTFDEDVRYLYNVLISLGYADDHIFYVSPYTTDTGVDRVTNLANVQWAANEVAGNSDAEDKVFFYYSAHGGVDSLECYPGSVGGGYVSSTDMDNWLDAITARELEVMLQGCHTGSFIGAYSTGTVVASENELTGDGETNRIAITATDTTHSSYGGPSSWGSTFTGGYVASFSDATADVDGNSAISVDEAYTYAVANDSAATAGWSFPQIDSTSLVASEVFHNCPGVDVWISDGPADSGNNSYDYDSPDIWSSLSPTGASHQDPVSGLTNYVHVVVHNLGSLDANDVDTTLYWADTSTALAWPTDFNQIGATYTFASIAAGGSAERTWSWYVDPAFGLGHHFCFVATADSAADPMTGGPGIYVAPYDNNIAQKNITIVLTQEGQSAHVWFFIENNMDEMVPFDLVITRAAFPKGQLILSLPDDLTKVLLEKANLLEGLRFIEREGRGMPSLLVTAEEQAAIRQIRLQPLERRMVVLDIMAPEGAEPGEEFAVRIEESTEKGEALGAITFEIRVVPPGDCLSTLRRAAEAWAQMALLYQSRAAAELVKVTGEALERDLCVDRQAIMEWKYAAFDLEAEIGKELEGQVPRDVLRAYLEATDALKEALGTGGFEEVMIAQEKVVGAAEELLAATSQ